MNTTENNEKDNLKKPGYAYSFGFKMFAEFAAGFFVSIFLGYWIDVWLDSKPLFFLVFFFVGLCVGAWNIYKMIKRIE